MQKQLAIIDQGTSVVFATDSTGVDVLQSLVDYYEGMPAYGTDQIIVCYDLDQCPPDTSCEDYALDAAKAYQDGNAQVTNVTFNGVTVAAVVREAI